MTEADIERLVRNEDVRRAIQRAHDEAAAADAQDATALFRAMALAAIRAEAFLKMAAEHSYGPLK